MGHAIWLVLLPLVMLGVSAAYFLADRRDPDIVGRLVYSSHGAIACLLLIGAYLASGVLRRRSEYGLVYMLLFLIPLAVVLVSFVRYRGPKLVHLLQIPNLFAMLWSVAIGFILIAGE